MATTQPTAIINSDDIIKCLLDLIQRRFTKFTITDFTHLVLICMDSVEKYKNLKGEDKKRIVLSVVSQFVNLSNLSQDDKTSINILIQTLAPTMIDGIICVANGEFLKDANTLCKKFCCY